MLRICKARLTKEHQQWRYGFYTRSVKTYNRLDLLNWQAGIMGKR
ncbi:23142_t:CDS:2, partial [Gigaspora rosea]